jgi:hypothetical protein
MYFRRNSEIFFPFAERGEKFELFAAGIWTIDFGRLLTRGLLLCIIMYLIPGYAEDWCCGFSRINTFHSESTWTFCSFYVDHCVSVGICWKCYQMWATSCDECNVAQVTGSYMVWWINVACNRFLVLVIRVVNNWSILWVVDSRLLLLESTLKDDCRLISLFNLWGVYMRKCMTKETSLRFHYSQLRIFPRMISTHMYGQELGCFPCLVSSVALFVAGSDCYT